jgi:5'-3' exonuclease
MGVPKFFAWLIRNYKGKQLVFQKEKLNIEAINWLLIDTNCLIHPICFKVLAEEQTKGTEINFKSLQNKMGNAVIDYIDKLVSYVEPTVGVYIAIDGPVCCAKIKQQRQRRYRSVHDKMLFDKIKEKHNKQIPYFWNNSGISPGTKFMNGIHNKILDWSSKQKIKVIYSSANTPGEGEHKLLDFIKDNNKQKLDLSYVTYGLDADLIFLMLVTKLDKLYLLREAQQFEQSASKDQLNFVSMKVMRDCIYDTFNKSINKSNKNNQQTINKQDNQIINKDRVINDFIFLCYFLGNDFLPHILALDISKNGVEYLVNKYSETFNEQLDYLVSVDMKNINQPFIEKFINKLSSEEDSILTKNFSKVYKNKYQGSDDYEKELFKIENLLFKIDDPIGVGVNSNYRNNYYKHYFDVNDDELEEFVEKLVKHYLRGVKWVSQYYFHKIIDWDWYYSYDYPPFITDIAKYMCNMNNITFKETKPMTPLEQLLIILPPQSKYLLPKEFVRLTNNPNSSLAHLYPIDFEIDFLYKHRYWEGIPKLPPLEIKLVRHAFKKYKDELTQDELNRNRLDKEFIFN